MKKLSLAAGVAAVVLVAAASAASATPGAGPAPAGTSSQVGSVSGAHALQLDALPAASTHIDRDPSVNKSLLLRLIAGVRGL